MKKIFVGLMLTTAGLFAEEGAAPAKEGGITQTLMMLGLVVVCFYFILWRPEQKRRKAQETLRSSLKKGDRAIALGIVGTVVRVEADTVILKMVDGSKIEVLKGAISEVKPGVEEAAAVESTSPTT